MRETAGQGRKGNHLRLGGGRGADGSATYLHELVEGSRVRPIPVRCANKSKRGCAIAALLGQKLPHARRILPPIGLFELRQRTHAVLRGHQPSLRRGQLARPLLARADGAEQVGVVLYLAMPNLAFD